MATLQKFKSLATQCAVAAGSPTRSPTASPVIHLRRRKTLRMLLNRSRFHRRRRDASPERDSDDDLVQEKTRVRRKLKDLFVSSPPPIDDRDEMTDRGEGIGLLPETGGGVGGIGDRFVARRGRNNPLRPVTAAFRHRLLKRAWRPMLVTIPE